jgi:zinc protease
MRPSIARALASLSCAFFFGLAQLACSVSDRDSVKNPSTSAGIDMTLLPSQNSPIVYFRILFRVGSQDDPAGKEGLSALTTAMLAQGGTRSLTYSEVLEALYPMAARIDYQADKEVVVVTGQCHRDHLDRYYPILRDAVLKPRFDPADFSRLRDEAVNYLANGLRGNDDENLGKWTLQLSLYPNHPYGHVDAGTVQGLKSMTLADVQSHYHSRFTREALDLGIAGGYPPDWVVKVRQDFTTSLPQGQPGQIPLPVPRMPEGIEVVAVSKPCIATAISAGFPTGVTRHDDDWYALLVANSYLGEHRTFNGVLMNELRGKRGLNYGDYSYIENFIQDGGTTFPVSSIPRRQQYFSFWLRPIPHRNALFGLRGGLYYLDKLVREGIPEEGFQQTRSFLQTYSRLWAQSLDQRLGYLQDSKFYGISDYLSEVQKRLPLLTKGQVDAAVRKHLQSRNLVVALVTQDGSASLQALLSGKPTPIHYDSPGTPPDILAEDKLIQKFPVAVNQARSRVITPADLFER